MATVNSAISTAPDRTAQVEPAPARRVQNRQSKIQNALVAALLLVLAFAFMTPGLPPERVAAPLDTVLAFAPWHSLYPAINPPFKGGDLMLQQLPWRHWMQQELFAGRFPLWAPAPVGGTSLLGAYQPGVLHPLHLLWALLPVGAGLSIISALKLWIAGLGMWGFLRALRLHPAAAALSALAFEFSAWMVDLLPWQITSIQCLLPWMVWAIYAWCQDRARWALPALAGLAACAIFGGHPETLFNVGVLLVLWAICLILLAPPRRWGWQIGGLALAAALGLALSAIQLLPFVETLLASHTFAVRAPSDTLVAARLGPENLLYWILPRSWGYFPEGVLTPGQSFVENNGYVGLVPLLGLIVTGAAAVRRRLLWRQVVPWIIIGIIGWLLIYDNDLGRLIRALPGFSQNANWRWLANLDFALLVVTAFGWDWLARWRPAPPTSRTAWWRGIGGMLLAQGLGLMAAHALGLLPPPVLVVQTGPWWITNDSYRAYWAIWALGIVAAAVGTLVLWMVGGRNRRGWPVLLGVILLVDLWRLLGSLNGSGPAVAYFPETSYLQQVEQIVPPTERILIEGDGLPPNTALVYGIRDWRAQDALMSERAYQAAVLLSPDLPKSVYTEYNFLLFHPRLPVAPLLGMRYYAYTGGEGAPPEMSGPDVPPFTRRAFKNGMGLWEIEGVPGFTYLSDNLYVADGEPAARAWMQQVTWPQVRAYMALVEAPPSAVAAIRHDPAGTSPGNVAVQAYTPGAIRLQTTATRPALLVVAETLAPGWRATLDGQPVPIWRANYLSQGVVVPAGTHTVELHYLPDSVVIGGAISVSALFVGLGLLLIGRRRRKVNVNG